MTARFSCSPRSLQLNGNLALKLGRRIACFQFSQRPDHRGVLQAVAGIFARLHVRLQAALGDRNPEFELV